jgi:ferredoxin--NADP+ reductase
MLDTAQDADVIDQGAFFACKVTEVEHFTDDLFRFRTARPSTLRFRPGEFLMIGLEGEWRKPVLRAYSVASPSWDDTLEFYSIKVEERRADLAPAPYPARRPGAGGTQADRHAGH